MALLLVALLRTAWVCDDAYITFRTVDNIVNGYGAVWNAGERVQAYTHPLWMAIVTVPYVVTREPYYTSMALSIALTLLTAVLLAKRLAPTPWTLLVCFVALLSSKAFVDFSTSGLENALTHALLALFVWRWWDAPAGESRLRQLAFIASLCLLTRLDLVVLVGPAVAIETWRFGLARAARPLLVGLVPLLVWETFSVFYYGSFVPNTAYAKVGAGLSRDDLLVSGQSYFLRTFWSDPATIPVMALGLVAGAANWPLAVGILLNALYVLWIGGDFMAGRFFTAPFLLSVCLLARARWAGSRVGGSAVAAALLLLGLLAPWEPALLSGYGYLSRNNLLHGDSGIVPRDKRANISAAGVMDERRWYYESSGLLKSRPGQLRPDNPMVFDGLELRKQGRQVVVQGRHRIHWILRRARRAHRGHVCALRSATCPPSGQPQLEKRSSASRHSGRIPRNARKRHESARRSRSGGLLRPPSTGHQRPSLGRRTHFHDRQAALRPLRSPAGRSVVGDGVEG